MSPMRRVITTLPRLQFRKLIDCNGGRVTANQTGFSDKGPSGICEIASEKVEQIKVDDIRATRRCDEAHPGVLIRRTNIIITNTDSTQIWRESHQILMRLSNGDPQSSHLPPGKKDEIPKILNYSVRVEDTKSCWNGAQICNCSLEIDLIIYGWNWGT